jgi:hypothetical protein
LTVQMHYTWNGNGWDSTSGDRFTYTYHNGNLIEEQIGESYGSFNHSWSFNERVVYHYNLQDERDTITYYYDDNGSWMPGDRLVDIVYHDMQKDLFAYYRYQEFTGTWDDLARLTYTYGLYDSYEMIEESFTGTWDSTYKDIVTVDAEGHVVLAETYSYGNGWEFYAGDISHFTYDVLGRTMEEWTEYYTNSAYQNGSKRIYDSFFVVGAPRPLATATTALDIWPNPCGDRLHVLPRFSQPTAAKVALRDLQGRLQWECALQLGASEVTLVLPEGLANGTYLFEVNAGGGRSVEKVVVLR